MNSFKGMCSQFKCVSICYVRCGGLETAFWVLADQVTCNSVDRWSSFILQPAVPATDCTQVWNDNWQGKSEIQSLRKACLSATFVHHKYQMDCPGTENRPVWRENNN